MSQPSEVHLDTQALYPLHDAEDNINPPRSAIHGSNVVSDGNLPSTAVLHHQALATLLYFRRLAVSCLQRGIFPANAVATVQALVQLISPSHAPLDEPTSDYESDYESESGDSSTTELEEDRLSHWEIDGRQYCSIVKGDRPPFPSDPEHLETLNLLHVAYTALWGDKLCQAPIKDVQRIVDIGTGTGHWAIEMAVAHPQAVVIGMDIAPVQQELVPSNVEFQIHDCNQELMMSKNSVDFIHMRGLAGSIEDWTSVHRQAFEAIKPGGYLESTEQAYFLRCGEASEDYQELVNEWNRIFQDAGSECGRSFTVVYDNSQRTAMEEAGFIVDIDVWEMPIGPWTTDQGCNNAGTLPENERRNKAGMTARKAYTNDLNGLLYHVTERLGWNLDQTLQFAERIQNMMQSADLSLAFDVRGVVGRKPVGPGAAY
ncbi:hypothetical protein ACHAPT_010759 [Fusarium lateritium]